MEKNTARNDDKNFFYQIKMIRKGTKPPVWRRAYVPANITFAQMALVLMALLEIKPDASYEFEFYHAGDRLVDSKEYAFPDYNYDVFNAAETFVNKRFDEEKWFTFRILESDKDFPDYRVEIEKKMYVYKELSDSRELLTYPMLLKSVAYKEDKYWSDGTAINRLLEKDYQITFGKAQYKKLQAVKADVEAGKGLVASKKPEDRNSLIKSSDDVLEDRLGETIRKLFSMDEQIDALRERILKKQAEGKIKNADGMLNELDDMKKELAMLKEGEGNQNRNPELKKYLQIFSIDELRDYADDYDLTITGKRKDKIISEIAGQMQTADKMKEVLLGIEEKDLDVFEKALDAGCFLPDEKEAKSLALVCDAGYVLEYNDKYMEATSEAQTLYTALAKDNYREYHRKMRWLIKCMTAFAEMLAVGSVEILYKMYSQLRDVKESYDEFLIQLGDIPDYYGACALIGDLVVVKDAIENAEYKDIQKCQRKVPYYIPSVEDISAISEDVYPSNEKAYRDLYEFFKTNKLEETQCRLLCIHAFFTFSSGGVFSDYMEYVNKSGFSFPSEKTVKKFVDILTEVNNNTRMPELRGHKPNEMRKLQGREQIERMSFKTDTDESAKAKKVYPNDPCPCGSGKKYKKCCGRNQ